MPNKQVERRKDLKVMVKIAAVRHPYFARQNEGKSFTTGALVEWDG